MRTALISAGICLFCLSQPGLADSGYLKLSKAGSDYSTFMGDRNDCLSASRHGHSYVDMNTHGTANYARYDFVEFSYCMRIKGYRIDANGYRAAWYSTPDGHRYTLSPNKPGYL